MYGGRTSSALTLMVVWSAVALGSGDNVSRGQDISYDSRTVLMGIEASPDGAIKPIDMGPGKAGWIQSWTSKNESLTWTANILRAGEYKISAIVESSGGGCKVDLTIARQALSAPCGQKRWNRVTLGTIQLPTGSQTIIFRSTGPIPLCKFFSLEVVRPQIEAKLRVLGRLHAAPTDWMINAKYGLMFHWTSETKPQIGVPKAYCDAVRDFDVERFAEVALQMGAGYVVFTTSHAGFYFPGPSHVIDAVLPGRTCPRDLIGDLAGALAKQGIKLELYFHPGHDDAPWWQRTHFNDDKAAYFELWCEVIRDVGERYGKRLAGFWFDDAAFTYYPYNPPWEKMTAAAKAGNGARLITYNSWILPRLNDFYEVFAGENEFSETVIDGDGYLPAGGTGKFTGGPQKGLQGQITTIVNGDWGHFKLNTPIGPPRYSTEVMIAKIKEAIERRNVPLLDIEVYQDGTISPETFQMFLAIRREIKPASIERDRSLPGSASLRLRWAK